MAGSIVTTTTTTDPLDGFDAFTQRVRSRLDAGRNAYGDSSFSRDPAELVGEIQQELLDVCGWSYVLHRRLEAARDALSPPPDPKHASEAHRPGSEAPQMPGFFDALAVLLQHVVVVPVNSAPMSINWIGIDRVQGGTWTCGHCGTRTSNDRGWRGDGEQGRHYIRVCPGCTMPSYFLPDGTVVPGVLAGSAVQHLPDDISLLHDEARRAIQARAFTASVMICRKILANIAVSKGADEGQGFAYYVEYLESNHYITPDGKAWVDYVRKRGNEANHEIVTMKEPDARGVLQFTEALLRNVFELPKLVPE